MNIHIMQVSLKKHIFATARNYNKSMLQQFAGLFMQIPFLLLLFWVYIPFSFFISLCQLCFRPFSLINRKSYFITFLGEKNPLEYEPGLIIFSNLPFRIATSFSQQWYGYLMFFEIPANTPALYILRILQDDSVWQLRRKNFSLVSRLRNRKTQVYLVVPPSHF